MTEGVIVGGWSYVIGAYAVVAIGLAMYAVSLFQRLRSVRRQLAVQNLAVQKAGQNDRVRAPERGRTEDDS
ncbi:MAG TPA: hypothetical protein VNB06_02135 [Thermoanaerobaculia bacterium]|nr:hypothetical protein [Thermoanaerobaculia bacterium]